MTERTDYVQGSRECDQYYRRRYLHCSLHWHSNEVERAKGRENGEKLQDNKIENMK